MFSIVAQGVKWLSGTAVEQCKRRPSDLFLGIIGATLLCYFWVGPNSFLSTVFEIFVTCLLMALMWWLVSRISTMAENSVFRLPDDERTREAEKLVESMVDAALD